jgi:hypothetical protein
MAEGQFDKDFAYLIPFLDKVAAAAGGLSDRASRDELTKLMADEKSRWTRIRSLLSGASGQSAKSGTQASSASPGDSSKPDQPGQESSSNAEPLRFTVGSLRQR